MSIRKRQELSYKDNQLHFDEVSISAFNKYETPFYLYSSNIFHKNLKDFKDEAQKTFPSSLICYAMKANSHPNFIKEVASLDCGVDVVSFGELEHAINNGINPNKIVFSGVGKTKQEIKQALEYGIYSFNVESFSELKLLNSLSINKGVITSIAIRLNPKVQTQTHEYISTGDKIHKFGILISEFTKHFIENDPEYWSNIKLKGLSVHIGSQLLNLDATKDGVQKLSQIVIDNNIDIDFIDVGGGLGINYFANDNEIDAPTTKHYMSIIKASLLGLDQKVKIVFEPGRRIVANCGIIVSAVIREKHSEGHNFLIIDTGMNDLMRPCLYQAKHQIFAQAKNSKMKKYDIVGPVCESSDSFRSSYEMPECSEEDRVIIADAGAYGKVLSNTYNMRTQIKEYFI